MGVCQINEDSYLLELDGEIFWYELDKSFMDDGFVITVTILVIGIPFSIIVFVIFIIRTTRK